MGFRVFILRKYWGLLSKWVYKHFRERKTPVEAKVAEVISQGKAKILYCKQKFHSNKTLCQ